MHIRKLIKSKHDEIMRIAISHGAVRIRLFGSAARGDVTKNSDIDVLVSMKPSSTILDIIAIKQDLEDILKVKVDVVTEESISPYIRESVFKEAVNL